MAFRVSAEGFLEFLARLEDHEVRETLSASRPEQFRSRRFGSKEVILRGNVTQIADECAAGKFLLRVNRCSRNS